MTSYLRVAAVIALAVMAGTAAISTFGPGGSGFGGTNATPSPSPTLENGQAVPVPYSVLGGEVSFAAAPPWSYTYHDRKSTTLGGVGLGSASQFTMFTVVADPLTGVGCEAGPAPADADALVQTIGSNPDLEATDPVAVSVGGIDALRDGRHGPGAARSGRLPAQGARPTLAGVR